ncbi:MAG: hypothetical protein WC450_11335 [Candidatus Omnitrophota bacterium]
MLKVSELYINPDPYLPRSRHRRWIWRPGWVISAIGLLAFLSMMYLMGLEIIQQFQYLHNFK